MQGPLLYNNRVDEIIQSTLLLDILEMFRILEFVFDRSFIALRQSSSLPYVVILESFRFISLSKDTNRKGRC